MKGVILAGGRGTRLGRHTIVLNKLLVAVGQYPMIEYPLATLLRIGIKDIIVVVSPEHSGLIINYLSNAHPNINFTYKIQKEAKGIAHALSLVEDVASGESLAVILGDNIFNEDFSEHARRFEEEKLGAMLFLKSVDDPSRFGVATLEGNKISKIVEKPKEPESDLAVTGLYFFDNTVFDKIRTLKPSQRGELEITDAGSIYVSEGRASFAMVNGFWSDAGTHKARHEAELAIKKSGYDPLKHL